MICVFACSVIDDGKYQGQRVLLYGINLTHILLRPPAYLWYWCATSASSARSIVAAKPDVSPDEVYGETTEKPGSRRWRSSPSEEDVNTCL